ncbi:MAG TPA: ABC transporter substrate-binding protein [bacterium]|nr:ABC transporter substrate-binding protein [bacterium]
MTRTGALVGSTATGRLSRRTLLKGTGGAAGLAVAGRLGRDRTAAAATAPTPNTLIMAPNFVIRSLDPGHTLEPDGEMVTHACYDALVTFDGADLSTPKPHVATSWKVSGGGRLYTFTLRQGIRFASGNPLTSADVKWSFDRVINLQSNPAFFLANVDEVQAPDPQTIVLRLKAPQPSILPILSNGALGIMDSKLVTSQGGDASVDAKTKDHAEAWLQSHSAGSGAFMIQSYTPTQELVLARNPNHWRAPAKMDRIVLRSVPESSTQALQLERGDLDLAMSLGQENLATLRRLSSVTIQSSVVATSFVMMVNMDPSLSGQLANPKVLQAIRYALDYDGILQIAGPGAQRMAGVIPNDLPGALDPREAVKTDKNKAKALLKDAGLSAAKGRLMFASDATSYGIQYSLLAQKIQSDLASVGITIDLDGLPGTIELGQYRAGKAPALFGGYAADYPDATDFLVYLPGQLVGKRMNWPASASPAAQELAQWGDQATQEADPKARVALLQKAQRRLLEIGPYAPLFTPALPFGFRSDVRGVTYNSVWEVDFYTIRRG